MLIAFEGPDEVGKSTSAAILSYDSEPIYNATKANHAEIAAKLADETTLVQTFDRIDWLTHMVYRLAMPERDWGDDRPRTVFAMPDTHLVLKMHHPQRAADIEAHGEGYGKGRLVEVNEMYFYQIDFLTALNRRKNYALFKSVSIIEVWNDQTAGVFEQRMASHDSAPFGHHESVGTQLVDSDDKLLEFLRYVDHHTA
jgi:hypothetical protein